MPLGVSKYIKGWYMLRYFDAPNVFYTKDSSWIKSVVVYDIAYYKCVSFYTFVSYSLNKKERAGVMPLGVSKYIKG